MPYDFSILRDLRKWKNLTINALSDKCGVSYVALSKLERNQGNPELRTLDRISRALGITTPNLLALLEREKPRPTKEKTCKVFGKAECRYFEFDGTRVFVVHAPKGASGSQPDLHDNDYERFFVLDGRIKVTIDGHEYMIGAGQGLGWDSLFEHTYEVVEPSTFIAVLTTKRM